MGNVEVWKMLGLRRYNRPGRFTLLLATLLFLLMVGPFMSNHAAGQMLLTMGFTMVLLASLYAFVGSRTFFLFGLVFMVPAFICKWLLLLGWSSTLEIVNAISTILFLALVVAGLVSRLFSIRRVTVDAISAAICAYLMMGAMWAFVFALVAQIDPAAFNVQLIPGVDSHSAVPVLLDIEKCLYYSFVCLTTIGFGDITPVSAAARMLSVMEAVFGQFYLAILIARLVGLQLAQALKEE